MDITLYHCENARSLRCLWTLEEMGVKNYKLVTMPFPPRYRHRKYLNTNVLGTVPFLQDRTESNQIKTLTESCAIPYYLVTKYGTPEQQKLIVRPEERDFNHFLNFMFQADATLTFPQTLILRYTMQEPGKADKVVSDYTKWYIARLKLLNHHLADGREFLCCDRFTICDICITYALFLGTTLKTASGQRISEKYEPIVAAYLKRMMSRPSWKAAQRSQTLSARAFRSSL